MVRVTYVVLLLAAVVLAQQSKPYYDISDAPALFDKFVEDYHREYKNDADREEHYKAFVNSLKVINEANSEPGQTATFDINEFADYTPEEQKSLYGLKFPKDY